MQPVCWNWAASFTSIALVPRLGTNFFDNSSQNTFTITQTLPVSTSLQQTDQAAQQVEAVLASVPGIQTYHVTIGSSGSVASSFSGESGSNSASYAVTTVQGMQNLLLPRSYRKVSLFIDPGPGKPRFFSGDESAVPCFWGLGWGTIAD